MNTKRRPLNVVFAFVYKNAQKIHALRLQDCSRFFTFWGWGWDVLLWIALILLYPHAVYQYKHRHDDAMIIYNLGTPICYTNFVPWYTRHGYYKTNTEWAGYGSQQSVVFWVSTNGWDSVQQKYTNEFVRP